VSRVFTVIGFWGALDEREVIGVIEGIHEVHGGDAAASNYADGGPFAVIVHAIDHESAESQVAGTTEDDDLEEVEFSDG
jgi:hypothetical protein